MFSHKSVVLSGFGSPSVESAGSDVGLWCTWMALGSLVGTGEKGDEPGR